MHDLRSLLRHQLSARYWLGLACLLVPLQVAAQSGPFPMPNRLDDFRVGVNGNIVKAQYVPGMEGYGTRISQTRGGVTGSAVAGGVSLSKQLAINTRNGLVVAEATQKISNRAIAKTLLAAASGPLGLAVFALPAIIDWMTDAGVEVAPDGSFTHETVTYGYQRTGGGWPIRATILEVCYDIMGSTIATSGFLRSVNQEFPTYDSLSIGCAWSANPGGNTYGATRWKSAGTNPATPQQVEDDLAATDAPPQVLQDLGDVVDYVPPEFADTTQLSNPQPSPTSTSTTTNPDGSTETKECQTTGTIVAGDLRLAEQCSITQRDPSGNVTGVTTTTTDTVEPDSPAQEDSLFCQIFPNVLACAELGQADEDIPTEQRSVDYQAETLFGGGSCPADQTIQFRGSTLPITNYAYACDMLATYVRPIALLLAAFTALMIIARGMPE